jgi:hypothetical protein
MSDLPLGKQESERLEFKSRDALNDRKTIAREAVALLNAKGGDLWLGIREENGYGVEVEPIPDASSSAEMLLDFLVDTVEPSPASGELEVKPVSTDFGEVIRVALAEGALKPYALAGSGGSRVYLTRIGARIRPMSRAEIAKAFAAANRSVEEATAQLREKIEQLLQERHEIEYQGGVLGRKDGFWLQIRPVSKIRIDLQAGDLEEMFMDPTRTGNRRTGWTFAGRAKPRLQGDRLVSRSIWGPTQAQVGQEIELREDGVITFSSSLSRLHWKGDSREIWPLILLELPISLLRFAARVYVDILDGESPVLVDVALLGVVGWSLREGTPGDWFLAEDLAEFEGSRHLTLPEPSTFRFSEIREQPDVCGFRIVRRIYQEFGLREENMPAQFDKTQGKLILPD